MWRSDIALTSSERLAFSPLSTCGMRNEMRGLERCRQVQIVRSFALSIRGRAEETTSPPVKRRPTELEPRDQRKKPKGENESLVTKFVVQILISHIRRARSATWNLFDGERKRHTARQQCLLLRTLQRCRIELLQKVKGQNSSLSRIGPNCALATCSRSVCVVEECTSSPTRSPHTPIL